MWWRAKDFNLNIKDANGYLIAIIRKTAFKYVFFICIEGNNFIDIKCDTEADAYKIVDNIKSQMKN